VIWDREEKPTSAAPREVFPRAPSAIPHLSGIFKERSSQPESVTCGLPAPPSRGTAPSPPSAAPAPCPSPRRRARAGPRRGSPAPPASFQLLRIPRAIKRDSSREQNQYREGRFWASTPFVASLAKSRLVKVGGEGKKTPRTPTARGWV